jgi:diguanylate cyclase (GGDEF)-like protein/PAS domain S-box-containing protein
MKGKTSEELVHDLQVHQIELEIQNEELKKAQLALEASRDKYVDLYDFAPVGYFTFTPGALIAEVNLTGAALLGVERQKLKNGSFRRFIAPEDLDRWDRHIVSVLQHGEKQSCDLVLKRQDGSTVHARFDSVRLDLLTEKAGVSGGNPVVRTAVRDITERKRAEEELRESKQRFEAIFDGAIDGLLLADLDTRKFNLGNRRICEMLGYELDEIKKIGFDDIHPKDALAHVLEQVRKQVAGEITVAKDLPVKRKNGSIFYADIAASPLQIGGKPFLLGIFRDITERQKTEEEKRQANEKLTVLVKKLEDRNYQNIIMGEMREMLQACSTMEEAAPIIRRSMEKLFPNSEGALFMMSPSRSDLESVARWGDFPKDVDDNVFKPDACWALRRGRTYIVENVSVGPLCPHLKHPPSTAYVCLPLIAKSDVLGLLHLRSKQSTQIQSEPNIISDLKDMAVILSEYLSLSIANIQLNERLARQSVRDPLTGLYNKRFMIESLEREIKRAERNRTQVGIIMADIDHFKQFNDKYGHAAGDKVLTQMGGFFKAGLRGSDVACRYGGEEFVFILLESSAENTFKRAGQMREEVKNLEVHYDGELLASITLSMGISTYPDQGSNAEDLLRVADAALYRAKQEGRDRIIIG